LSPLLPIGGAVLAALLLVAVLWAGRDAPAEEELLAGAEADRLLSMPLVEPDSPEAPEGAALALALE
jgi:hypothetical protein